MSKQATLGNIAGKVYGGQQPVAGARLYVFATGTTAYAGSGIAPSASNASTSLLTAAVLMNNPTSSGIDGSGNYYVTTDSNGGFLLGTNLSAGADYTCTTGTDVYIYATGGNPGSGINTAAGFLALLGPCPSNGGNLAATVPNLLINEVSTIAAAYSIAGFATDATHISNSGTALGKQGMNNAFASSNKLVNIASGSALATTLAGNGTVPQTTIYTLANILAACINSTGAFTLSPASNCYTLFTDTGTNTSLDTATVAIKLAQNPSAIVPLTTVSAYNITNDVATFTVPSGTAPAVGLTVDLNGFTTSAFLAYQSLVVTATSGTTFTANINHSNIAQTTEFGTVSATYVSSLFALQNAQSPFPIDLSSAPNDFTIGLNYNGGGLSNPFGLAIDGTGNIWATNLLEKSIAKFNGSTGAAISGPLGYTGGGLNEPIAIAIDGSGNAWITDNGGSCVTELNGSTGAAISTSSGFTGGGLDAPGYVAVDGSGDVWITNSNNSVTELNSSGSPISSSAGDTGGSMLGTAGLAVDASGNVWVANTGNLVSELNSNGMVISGATGFTGGGLSTPVPIAIDASGNVWVGNNRGETVSEFNSSGSAVSIYPGYYGGGTSDPWALAIDGAGNVWAAGESSISVLNGSDASWLSGPFGYTSGGQGLHHGLGIDGSGNVWVTNYENSSITELIGAATPVVTPLQYGVANNKIASRP